MKQIPGIDGVGILVVADIRQVTPYGSQCLVIEAADPGRQFRRQGLGLALRQFPFAQGRQDRHLHHAVGIFRVRIGVQIGMTVLADPRLRRMCQVMDGPRRAIDPIMKPHLGFVEIGVDLRQHIDETPGALHFVQMAFGAEAQERVRNDDLLALRQRLFRRRIAHGRGWRLIAELRPTTADHAVRLGLGRVEIWI